MQHSLRKLCSAVLLLAFMVAAMPIAASAATWKETWSPTIYKESALNAQKFCTLTAEYPVYRAGTTELHLILTNKTNEMLGYGLPYVLERKLPDGWYTQKVTSTNPDTVIGWPAIGLVAPAKAASGISVSLYFPLQPGEYRIIKDFSKEKPGSTDYPFAAYFTVSADGYDSTQLSSLSPIKTLTANYTFDQAIAEGAFFQSKDGKVYNKENLLNFLTKVQQGIPVKIRMLAYDNLGSLVISDVSYLGEGLKDFYRFFLEQCTLASSNKPFEIMHSYYPYLISYKKSGAYGLFLSERNTTKIKTEGVDEWTLLQTIRSADRKKIPALLKDPFNAPVDPQYRVYDASGSNYAYFYSDREEHSVCYMLQNGKNSDVDLSALKVSLKKLLDMEWSGQDLILTYRTAEGTRCVITYDTLSDNIKGVV